MKTASGATSIGAPHSAARYASEAQHAADSQYQVLLLTEEGRSLLSRFARSVGFEIEKMDDEEASNFIDNNYVALFSFLCGVTFCFSKI